MRPRLARAAYVRTYVGELGRSWIVVGKLGEPRWRLDARTHAVVAQCDGTRTLDELARDEPAAEALLAPLIAAGAIVDAMAPAPPASRRARGLEPIELAAGASLRLVLAPGGFDCDGRGGCCRLYDRVGLTEEDVGRVADCFGAERTPGGLYVDSAIVHDRPDEDALALAVIDGGCTLLDADGRCGIHARAGVAAKPESCRFYPARDVVCGDELHVGVAVECRCAVDFHDAPPAQLRAMATELLARRLRLGVAEAVAAEVPLTVERTVARAEYLRWRAGAAQRLGDDPLAWALAEAAALVGGAPRAMSEILAALAPLVDALAAWLAFEAADCAAVYSRDDLQRQLFAWAAVAAERLRSGHEGTIVIGERVLAQQLLHGHGLLRAATLAEGLFSLGLRISLARAGGGVALPSSLLPITAVEYLARTFSFGRVLDGPWPIEATLATT
ncbi:MAG: YkgJ family cysteine cluster protein [Polyangia bacterium]